MKSTISVLLALLLWMEPYVVAAPAKCSEAKDITLNVLNPPSKHYNAYMKQYMIALRKRMEEGWDRYDPRSGETMKAYFIIDVDGSMPICDPITINVRRETAGCAGYAIEYARPFSQLPANFKPLQIVASFKSRKINPGIDSSALLSQLAQAAIAAGFVALAGYGIYQLCKMDARNSTPYGSGYTNPNLVYVNAYRNQFGTLVPAHYRTLGNSTQIDNLSTKGNYNYFTDEWGRVVPTH